MEPDRMSNEHAEEACDGVDAMVFSGDALEDPENRRRFQWYLDRWQKRVMQLNDERA